MILALLTACGSAVVWPETVPEPCVAGALPSGETLLRVTHDEVPRSALVWAPAEAGPHDVVFNLHDFRAEPRRQNHYTRWLPFAASRGLVLVGPDGRSATWNAGHGCCGRAVEKNSDDRGFLDVTAARIAETACPSGRLLATGLGNGAMMAHRWACESDVVDAVISVGGALQLDACENTRPIPMIHYHGELDAQYPQAGNSEVLPVSAGIEVWKRRNQAVGEPVVWHEGKFSCRRWEGAAPVVWCTVQGMVDIWPGSAELPPDAAVPLSDATAGAFDQVVLPWWDAHR